jgi:hypothetical protein
MYALFSLCFWHILFPKRTESIDPDSDIEIVAGFSLTSNVVPDVFVTPYQDAPLDLGLKFYCKL